MILSTLLIELSRWLPHLKNDVQISLLLAENLTFKQSL